MVAQLKEGRIRQVDVSADGEMLVVKDVRVPEAGSDSSEGDRGGGTSETSQSHSHHHIRGRGGTDKSKTSNYIDKVSATAAKSRSDVADGGITVVNKL